MDSVAELHGDSPSYLKIAIQEASYNTDIFISGCSSNLLTCIVYNIAIVGKKPLLFRRIRGHLIKDLSGKWPMVPLSEKITTFIRQKADLTKGITLDPKHKSKQNSSLWS